MIIAIVFGVTVFLILLLALWYYGCLCCLSRKKRKNRPSTKYEKMNVPTVIIIPDLECGEYAGGGAEMTQADIGAGGMDLGEEVVV